MIDEEQWHKTVGMGSYSVTLVRYSLWQWGVFKDCGWFSVDWGLFAIEIEW